MRKLTLNILQPVGREKLRLRSGCASMQSGLCLCFSPCSVCNFVDGWVECDRGFTASGPGSLDWAAWFGSCLVADLLDRAVNKSSWTGLTIL